MTEDEAKTKWCPFSRELSETYTQQGEFRVCSGFSYNRSPDPDDDAGPYVPSGSLCLGSACMAWRWGGRKTAPTISAIAGQMKEAGTGPLDAVGALHEKAPDGYCGLAGAPQ